MASQTTGIQQLLVAEKRAAEKVNEARKRKARRLKQAKEEAQQEVDRYRQDRDRQFKEFEAKHLGSRDDVAARIQKECEVEMRNMGQSVDKNQSKVIKQLLTIVCDIHPQVHPNLKSQRQQA